MTKKTVVRAVQAAYTQIKDINNGWPIKELFEPPEKTLERLRSAAAELGVALKD